MAFKRHSGRKSDEIRTSRMEIIKLEGLERDLVIGDILDIGKDMQKEVVYEIPNSGSVLTISKGGNRGMGPEPLWVLYDITRIRGDTYLTMHTGGRITPGNTERPKYISALKEAGLL